MSLPPSPGPVAALLLAAALAAASPPSARAQAAETESRPSFLEACRSTDQAQIVRLRRIRASTWSLLPLTTAAVVVTATGGRRPGYGTSVTLGVLSSASLVTALWSGAMLAHRGRGTRAFDRIHARRMTIAGASVAASGVLLGIGGIVFGRREPDDPTIDVRPGAFVFVSIAPALILAGLPVFALGLGRRPPSADDTSGPRAELRLGPTSAAASLRW